MKKIITLCLIALSLNTFADYLVLINNNKYTVKETVEAPVSSTIVELYPFPSLTLASGYTSDGTRHYKSGSSYATYTSPDNYSKIMISIPTERGPASNKRLNLRVSVNNIIGETCEVINSNSYELFYCEFTLNNVVKDDIIKIEGVGAGKYTIFGNLTTTEEVITIEFTN